MKYDRGSLTNKSEMMGASYGRDGTMSENGADFRRNASLGTGETACPTPSTKSAPAPATASRAAGAATSDDDLTDTDEGVSDLSPYGKCCDVLRQNFLAVKKERVSLVDLGLGCYDTYG